MSGTFDSSTRGAGVRADLGPGLVDGVRQVMDRLRGPAEAPPVGVVDVRAAILAVLAERSASGSEIIRELQSRSAGARPPGAGAVYPMLQLLADEGLATATEADGRRHWSLTDAGRVAAEAAGGVERPRSDPQARRLPTGRGGLARAGIELVQTAALVGQTGTREQVAEAIAELDRARRRLLAVLTRD